MFQNLFSISDGFKNAKSLVCELKEYVNTSVAQAELSIAEKLSKIVTCVIIMLMVALVFFLRIGSARLSLVGSL
ncbi:MAG: hypothetical protein EPN92_12095 [Chitinophagaceae bacterium]|nr:MAG: hypothetical protein EPN92_12095 [Chitinophagaceae bacterium]